MCEVLAVAFASPEPFATVLPWAMSMERLGVAGFGWGAAWLDDAGTVRRYRHASSLAEDAEGRAALANEVSSRFLVHLRRPSRLSTVQEADTQPFLADDAGFAFCHNGSFERAEEVRERYSGRLKGRADSEVGFSLFQDRLRAGSPAAAALEETLAELGGTGNLGYLGQDGALMMLGGHPHNILWRFRRGPSNMAATGLHSEDESVFDLVFRDATDRERVVNEVAEVGEPKAEPHLGAAS